MKLLFDENLSGRLVELLSDVYPGSEQALGAGLGGGGDDAVWKYAKARSLTIVSKDSDLADLSVLRGAPPKVIWLRMGNCRTAGVEFLLRNSAEAVVRFVDGQENVLVLGRR